MSPKKFRAEKLRKILGVPLAFFQFFGIFFVEFLMFASWNCLGRIKNNIYRRRLLISSIYSVKN